MTTKKITRRDFLRLTAASAGAAVLTACGADRLVETATQSPTPKATQTPVPTATDTPVPPTAAAVQGEESTPTTEPTATATEVPPPDLVVVRNGEPEELVRAALEAIGGMDRFVFKGADVIIKPNICVDFRGYEWGATTNPWVVGALVKLAFEAGASRVRVMDQTWKRNMTKSYRVSGIQEQVEAAGGEMEWMPLEKFIPTPAPLGVELTSFDIYEEILKTDVLINVPVAKHHMNAKLTLSMKNLMGVIGDRPVIHKNFGHRIADLASAITPTLNVMDAVRVMKKNGPMGFFKRDTHKMDMLMVSTDMVALDAYTTRLFDMQPEDLDYVVRAAEMGLGRMDVENLQIVEIDLA